MGHRKINAEVTGIEIKVLRSPASVLAVSGDEVPQKKKQLKL